MKIDRSFLRHLILGLAAMAPIALHIFAQPPEKIRLRDTLDMGRGMSPLNADLIQIAVRSNFFLIFGEQLQLSPVQRKSLEDLFIQIQQANVRSEADLVSLMRS